MTTSSQDVPGTVRWALILAVASVAIGLVKTVREFLPFGASIYAAKILGTALVMTGLWTGVIYLVATRRNWARWLFIVSQVLAIPGVVFSIAITPDVDGITAAVFLSTSCANVAAAVLLLLPDSSRWFRIARVSAA